MSTVDLLSYVEGLYTDVPPHLVPPNALYVMSNVNTSYKLGAILKRPGYVIKGSALESGNAITGLHNFRQSASTQKMLATVNDSTDDDTQLFYSTGTTWTEITDAETAWANKANINVEMEDFISYCFLVGYGSTDGFIAPRTLTGTTLGTTNTTSMPNAKFIKRYRDRLYIGNTDIAGTATPGRVYFSSVPVAGAITWDTTNDLLNTDHSEEITGLGENWDRLLIFTEYSAYMYNQSEQKKTWDIGCSNHRTIRNSGAMMIWANRDGVWASTSGRPENVAGRVIDFIRGANMTNSFAEVVDEEYHLYLGDVTVNGLDYANCSLILNIPTMTWRVAEYHDDMTIYAKFYSSGQDFLWAGASDGKVHGIGKYTDGTLLKTDNGSPIHSMFQTGGITLGVPSVAKRLNKILAYADRSGGLKLKARVIDNNTQGVTEFKDLGELTKYINEFQINPSVGNILQIEGVENGSLPYWSVFGFSIDASVDQTFKK